MLCERKGHTGLNSPASAYGESGSEIVIEVTGAIALRVHEHSGAGDISITIPAAEDEDRQRLPFDFLPLDRSDLPPDQFCVLLAFDFCRRAHDWE